MSPEKRQCFFGGHLGEAVAAKPVTALFLRHQLRAHARGDQHLVQDLTLRQGHDVVILPVDDEELRLAATGGDGSR